MSSSTQASNTFTAPDRGPLALMDSFFFSPAVKREMYGRVLKVCCRHATLGGLTALMVSLDGGQLPRQSSSFVFEFSLTSVTAPLFVSLTFF